MIVSEPLDKDRARWESVPENCVVVARAGRPVEVLPFLDQRRIAAE